MARGVKVAIDADATGLRRGVDDAERSLNRLHSAGSKSLKGLGVAAVATGAVAFGGLAAAIRTGTQEMLEQEKASAQTAAAIKSTGGAANVTKDQIETMSSALQRHTGMQDDAIQSAQNLILTFTNVKNVGTELSDQVFNRATTTALDLSVAFGKDLSSSAMLVGKALNSPIQGLSALGRVGVQFTKDQKEQIKTLVESGRTLDAQKLILKELNTQVGGSARAAANTTAGQLARIQRAWEDVSEGLVREFLPIITDVARAVLRNMDKVQRVFEGVASAAKGMVRFISALFRGDWQQAWDIAVDGAGKALRGLLIIIEKVLYPIAEKAGRAIASGMASGLEAGLRKLPGGMAIGRALGLFAGSETTVADFDFGAVAPGRSTTPPNRAAPNPRGGRPIDRARGGVIPGRFDGRDDVPVNLSRGEVVLNPTQQRIVGIDRIMSTLRATGGVVGGTSFNTGGIVGAAYERATSKLGTAYQYGAWDCSKFATYVAGVNVGGSTATAYPMSSPAKGGEAIVWGFRNNGSGNVYDGGRDEHMGVGIMTPNGRYRWFDNGGGGVQSDADSARWEQVRVPRGLEGLRLDGGSDDTRGNTRGQGTPRETPLQRTTRLLRLTGAFGKVGARSGLAKSLISGAPDLSDGSAPGFTPGQDRAVSRAGRTAAAGARAAGKSPSEVSRIREAAERDKEISILRRQVTAAGKDLNRLSTMKAATLKAFRTLGRKKVGPKGRAAKKKLMAQFRVKLGKLTAEITEVRDEIADLNERLMDIGEQIADEAYEAGYEEPATADSATESAADAGPSPDAQAQIDQANQRASTAENDSRAFGAFVEALRGSGNIDPAGGVTVNQYIEGSLVQEASAASWIVSALGRQGGRTSGTVVSAA